jgi:hypothetical protein
LRSLGGSRFSESRQHALGRRSQRVAEQIQPGVFNVMRQTSDHKNHGIVAAAKDPLCLDAEPLRPRDANEI